MGFLKTSVCLVLVLILLMGCSSTVTNVISLNDNPPDYIKDLVIYREGYDAVVIYFVLADKNGQETRADGALHLTVTLKGFPGETRKPVMDFNFNFTKDDFMLTTVGSGIYERKRIIYSFGRIKYNHYDDPSPGYPWTVNLTIRTGGKILRAEEKFF